MNIYWPESAVREVAVLNEALDNATAEVMRLRALSEERAERLQAAAEEVRANALLWEKFRERLPTAEAMHTTLGLWITTVHAMLVDEASES